MVRVLVLQHEAGDRFRTLQYFDKLKALGFEMINPHWDIRKDWKSYLNKAAEVDVVWISRVMLPLLKLMALKKNNPNLVFDFDDALYLRSSRHTSSYSISKIFKFKTMVRSCKKIIAGNSFLAEAALKYSDKKKVNIIPTTVNKDWYELGARDSNKPFVVGWLGSKATLMYLETLKGAFEKFHEKKIPWNLLLVSDAFPDWPHLPVKKMQWSLHNEKKSLEMMDVGLNPLQEDDWCRGKCALKAVQYMAAGAPLIATPVGVNTELAADNRGWLARSDEEWLEALMLAQGDRQICLEKGQEAREWVLDNYSMESQVDKLVRILTEASQ